MTKKQAAVFVLGMFLLLGGIDILLAIDDAPGNTYSEVIRKWSYSLQWLPYLIAGAFGALLTHWFAKPYEPDPMIPEAWQERPLRDRLIRWGLLVFTVALAGLLGFLW